MEYTKYSEAPERFHFWTAVSTIAGALRRRVWIDQHYFQWTPNFYIIFVGPPGVVSKTTTASVGERMLQEIPGVKFGPKVITWQSLVTEMANARVMEVMTEEMYAAAYPNSQGYNQGGDDELSLLDKPYYPMSCLHFTSGEFGNLLDPRDRSMVDVLVSLWDSQLGEWSKKTKTQGGDSIENPCINIIACTTPSWIKESMPPYFIHGGLASRCVFVYGDKKKQLVAYPGLSIPDTNELAEQHAKLVEDLESISNLFGAYQLTSDAVAWGTEWYRAHWTGANTSILNARFGGYIARKQTHLHKLAIILAAAQRNELLITKEDLEQANVIVSALEPTMERVFDEISANDDTRGVNEIIQIVAANGMVEKSALFNALRHSLSLKQFDECLQGATYSGYVKQVQKADNAIYVVAVKKSMVEEAAQETKEQGDEDG